MTVRKGQIVTVSQHGDYARPFAAKVVRADERHVLVLDLTTRRWVLVFHFEIVEVLG